MHSALRVTGTDLRFQNSPDLGDAEAVRYLAAWQPPDEPVSLLQESRNRVLGRCRHRPFRLVTRALAHHRSADDRARHHRKGGRMRTRSVLTIHRDRFDYAAQQRDQVRHEQPERAAAARHVGLLRFGTLALTVLDTLRRFGFPCAGGSRMPRTLDKFLARANILIYLLPLADSTRGLLGASVFDALPACPALVQAGRGPQLSATALLASTRELPPRQRDRRRDGSRTTAGQPCVLHASAHSHHDAHRQRDALRHRSRRRAREPRPASCRTTNDQSRRSRARFLTRRVPGYAKRAAEKAEAFRTNASTKSFRPKLETHAQCSPSSTNSQLTPTTARCHEPSRADRTRSSTLDPSRRQIPCTGSATSPHPNPQTASSCAASTAIHDRHDRKTKNRACRCHRSILK
ncbi:Glyoxylate/hydroxypyruvate reductase A [Burkholderia gladioli]|nr:Glyoxylate/hydroxypyruvate reductase A [Burkholderia gladioli]